MKLPHDGAELQAGFEGAGFEVVNPVEKTLTTECYVPPFSVLDARQGYWQRRKKNWLALGIQSELGRGEALIMRTDAVINQPGLNYYRDANRMKALGKSKGPQNPLGRSAQTADPGYYARQKKLGTHQGGSAVEGQDRLNNAAAKFRALRRDGFEYREAVKNGTVEEYNEQQRQQHPAYPHGRTGSESTNELWRNKGYKDRRPEARMSGSAIHDQSQLNRLIRGGKNALAYNTGGGYGSGGGTSVFDPVLTELMYRWLSPPAGKILDPFAGGSVRGIVAAKLGRRYAGIDLRPEQCEANYGQLDILAPGDPHPRWIPGDARDINELLGDERDFDFLLTCPPYFNLEVYSDDPRDLSNCTTYDEDFLEGYGAILSDSFHYLRPHRFACLVVSDIRGKDGYYHRLRDDTVRLAEAAGARLYNEAILVTAVGSLPVRTRAQFSKSRKFGRTHQNVLVFCNGDPVKATAELGPLDDLLEKFFGSGTADGTGDDPDDADPD